MRKKNIQNAHSVLGPDLSPRQVAEAIGVSASSLKRWCDRGDLPTTKTVGGHRRISVAAVLGFLRAQGFDAKRPDLLGLPAGTRLNARDATEVLPQIVSALLEGDEQHLISLLTGLYLAKRTLVTIADQFIQPAFAEIGNRWAAGTVEVYQEHRAVVVASNAMHHIRGYLPEPLGDAPVAISATLSGDPYLLPMMSIDLGLREIGWNSIVLGPNHPPATLVAALGQIRPRLICINVSFIPDEGELVAGIETLFGAASDLGVPMAVGGGRLDDNLRRQLPCTAHCASIGELVSFARGLEPNVFPSSNRGVSPGVHQ